MADFFNEKNWSDPGTLALLGMGAGMLDPRGGMAAGFQGAMQGMQAGQQWQQRQALAQQQAEKQKKTETARELLRSTMEKFGNDPRKAAQALIATGDPDIMAHGFLIQKNLPKVKTTAKILKDGQEFTQPIFDTGEFGEIGGLPNAVKPIQVNQGSQISFVDPYSLQAKGQMGVGMSPGEGARLSQSERQFAQSHGLAQQNALMKAQELAMKLDPQYQAQMAGAKAGAVAESKAKAEIATQLPESIGTLAESLNLSDELKNHPALETMVGSLPQRSYGQAKALYGGNDEADFSAKMEQAQGKQFLSAIQGMKGFGALTEMEGNKMQSSAAAMSTAQSPAAFRKANDDYQAALLSGTRKIAKKLGVPESEIMGMLNKEREALRPQAPKKPGGASGSFDYGNRIDGTKKGKGYFGEITTPNGNKMTELSIGVNIGGKDMEIPSIVPTLNKSEIDYLAKGGKPTESIVKKAVAHAKQRLAQGKDPFAQEGEQANDDHLWGQVNTK